jgi:hypothetical protein
MSDAIKQEPITVHLIDGSVAIPHGLKLIRLHSPDERMVPNRRMIAHVEGWTPNKEYVPDSFDLYELKTARAFVQEGKLNDMECNQDWWDDFGQPTRETKLFNGEWDIREA